MIFEIYGVMMELLVCEEGQGIYRVSWQLKYRRMRKFNKFPSQTDRYVIGHIRIIQMLEQEQQKLKSFYLFIIFHLSWKLTLNQLVISFVLIKNLT